MNRKRKQHRLVNKVKL